MTKHERPSDDAPMTLGEFRNLQWLIDTLWTREAPGQPWEAVPWKLKQIDEIEEYLRAHPEEAEGFGWAA